jgi:CubicO group peptidase (beta-lactamase class C family)
MERLESALASLLEAAKPSRPSGWEIRYGAGQVPDTVTGQPIPLNAYLIERSTGRSYADELQARILRPLALTQTFPALADGRPLPMPRPYLHGYIADNEGALVDVSQQGADDSSMISTPQDIGRFFTVLFSGRLLPAAGLRQMMSVPGVPYRGTADCLVGPLKGRACYGLGLQRLMIGNGTALWGKTGSDLGYFITPMPSPGQSVAGSRGRRLMSPALARPRRGTSRMS